MARTRRDRGIEIERRIPHVAHIQETDDDLCPDCDGTGKCAECEGMGCSECDDEGNCPTCDGQGKIGFAEV